MLVDALVWPRHRPFVNEAIPSSPARPAPSDVASAVLATRAGDEGAFGRLHGLFARMVHAILLARVPYREAEDLTQDVFLTALRKLDQLSNPAAFGPWVAQIARNRAHDFHRRGRRFEALPAEVGQVAAPAAEAKEALEAIRGLPASYRETVMMRLVEGMTGPEIADRMGMTSGSVRVNLHRGMRMLRDALGAKEAR